MPNSYGVLGPQAQPSGLLGFFQQNPAMLLGMASGLAGAPSMGTGLSRGFANATQGAQQDRARQMAMYKQAQAQAELERERRSRAALSNYLKPKLPGMEALVDADPATALEIGKAQGTFGTPTTDDIKEFQYAKKNGFTGTFMDFLGQKKAATGDVYGTPIYGTDPQGNTVLGVLGKDGTFRKVNTNGVTPTPGVRYLDTGTGYVPMSSRSGQQMGQPIAKDVAGEAQQKAYGKATGEARSQLPGDLASAQQAIDLIEQMKTHPGREAATGLSSYNPFNMVPGTDAYNFNVMNRQLQGKTFLEAYATLKGGGQITEVEGQKAENAIARLDRAQSEDEYLRALNDLEQVIRTGMDRAKQRAGVAGQGNAAQGTGQGFGEGQTATNPQTGQRIIYRNGQWVPM